MFGGMKKEPRTVLPPRVQALVVALSLGLIPLTYLTLQGSDWTSVAILSAYAVAMFALLGALVSWYSAPPGERNVREAAVGSVLLPGGILVVLAPVLAFGAAADKNAGTAAIIIVVGAVVVFALGQFGLAYSAYREVRSKTRQLRHGSKN